jgi:hypothetical protein
MKAGLWTRIMIKTLDVRAKGDFKELITWIIKKIKKITVSLTLMRGHLIYSLFLCP